jgi:5-formyltetrahydrofolate cyclo-ligase
MAIAVSAQKQMLRRLLMARLKAQDPAAAALGSAAVSTHLSQFVDELILPRYSRVALCTYLPLNYEVDLMALMRHVWTLRGDDERRRCDVFVPLVVPGGDAEMLFVKVCGEGDLAANFPAGGRYGIRELKEVSELLAFAGRPQRNTNKASSAGVEEESSSSPGQRESSNESSFGVPSPPLGETSSSSLFMEWPLVEHADSAGGDGDDAPRRPLLIPWSCGGSEKNGRFAAGAAAVVVMCPGVAFDATGRRLGKGGHYYDKAVARLRGSPMSSGAAAVICVGVAFDFQCITPRSLDGDSVPFDGVPTDEHDVAMDYLVSPSSGVQTCHS